MHKNWETLAAQVTTFIGADAEPEVKWHSGAAHRVLLHFRTKNLFTLATIMLFWDPVRAIWKVGGMSGPSAENFMLLQELNCD